MIGRALKVLASIKRNTNNCSSMSRLRVLYSSLVRSIMEHGVVFWHPHLASDVLRMERVQNIFLSYAALLLKINLSQRDYNTLIRSRLHPSNSNLSMVVVSKQIICSSHGLLDGPNGSPDFPSTISFRVSTHSTRNTTFSNFPVIIQAEQSYA